MSLCAVESCLKGALQSPLQQACCQFIDVKIRKSYIDHPKSNFLCAMYKEWLPPFSYYARTSLSFLTVSKYHFKSLASLAPKPLSKRMDNPDCCPVLLGGTAGFEMQWIEIKLLVRILLYFSPRFSEYGSSFRAIQWDRLCGRSLYLMLPSELPIWARSEPGPSQF